MHIGSTGSKLLDFILNVKPSTPKTTATSAATTGAALPAIKQSGDERAVARIISFIAKILHPTQAKKTAQMGQEIFGPSASSDGLERVQMSARHRESLVRAQSSVAVEAPPLLVEDTTPPPLHHLTDPDCRVKITPEQKDKIQQFVDLHEQEWSKEDFPRTPYKSSKEGLPFTMDVFRENGELHIMVRCKEKFDNLKLGSGMSKHGTFAVDWETGNIYADVALNINTPEEQAKFKQETEVSQKLGKKAGIAQPFFGFHTYLSEKTGTGEVREKTAAYMPFYNTATTADTPQERREVLKDLLKGLVSLRAAGYEHGDIKQDNIFLDDAAGEKHAYIADLGWARAQDSQDYKNYGRGGVVQYASPQKRRAADLQGMIGTRKTVENEKLKKIKAEHGETSKIFMARKAEAQATIAKMEADVKSFIDETTLKNDAWSVGLLMLQVLQGKSDPDPNALPDPSIPLSAAQKIAALLDPYGARDLLPPDRLTDPLKPANYPIYQAKVAEILADLRSELPAPTDQETLQLVAKLLLVDPHQRANPDALLRET